MNPNKFSSRCIYTHIGFRPGFSKVRNFVCERRKHKVFHKKFVLFTTCKRLCALHIAPLKFNWGILEQSIRGTKLNYTWRVTWDFFFTFASNKTIVRCVMFEDGVRLWVATPLCDGVDGTKRNLFWE